MQIKKFADTMGYLRKQMLNGNAENTITTTTTTTTAIAEASVDDDNNVNYSEEVQPVIIRKTPKFPSRERHLAIRRKKLTDSPESQKSQILDFHVDSSDESSCCSCCDTE